MKQKIIFALVAFTLSSNSYGTEKPQQNENVKKLAIEAAQQKMNAERDAVFKKAAEKQLNQRR